DEYVIKRTNKAYISLISKDFSDTIGQKCFTLLRKRITPCDDCLMKKSLENKSIQKIERTAHPCGSGSVSISFSPVRFTMSNGRSCIIEHIRDISILEELKNDLETKNRTLAGTMKNLKAAQQSIREELRLARLIQQSILPKDIPSISGLKISLTYHPITDVGGDIYDFISFSPTRIGVFVGDASGHGLAAAFVATISKMSLYNHSKNEMPICDLLTCINNDLLNNIHTGHYLTCFWGIFDLEKNNLTFSRAGHPIPVMIKKNGTVIPLKTAGTFIGLINDTQFEQQEVSFEKGDRFYIFTDGIYEVLESNSNNDTLLGYDRFVQMLLECKNQPFGKVLSTIQTKLKNYTYEDDYTLIALESTANKLQDSIAV
ncbi:MAG TPA: PP2C family protein-serine/threonine phosphatase, partial [Chitinispirillaceae bacterium]|nr:PP2C family protein-serine/threonine phosphatase [Chitinispirillaceae bacterium]